MNFSGAIQAHANWKTRLANYCRGALAEPLDVGTLVLDNVCELGKWLHGEGGRQFGTDPDFEDLTRLHAQFHRSAAGIARMVPEGRSGEAEEMVQSRTSEFGQLSVRLVGILMGFRDKYPNG